MLATNAGLLTPILGDPSPWNPERLYINGEAGAWYDPGDLTAEKVAWRRNLLTWSEQFDNAAWVKTNATVTANAATDPFGTTAADLVAPTTTNAAHFFEQTLTIAAGATYTLSVYAKNAGQRYVNLAGSTATFGANNYVQYDLQTGTVSGSVGTLTGSIVNMGSGWYRLLATGVAASTAGNLFVVLSDGTASRAPSFVGNPALGIEFFGAMVNPGGAESYQRITDFTSDFLAAFPTHALYQDSAGTTPVTALGQPVGLALDKSRGALANIGAEVVTNGDFSSGTGWNAPAGWAIGSGVATATATNASLTGTGFPVVAGRTYRVSFDVVTFGGGTLFVRVGTGTATTFTSAGTKVCFLTASSTTGIEFYGGGVTCTLDNVSVREVPGVHAIQPTSASRPALDARVNLLLNTGWAGAVAGSPGTVPTSWAFAFTTGSITSVTGDGVGNNALTFAASGSRIVVVYTFAAAANTTYYCDVLVSANTGLSLDQILGFTSAPAGSTLSYQIDGAPATAISVPSAGSRARIILSNGATAGTPDLRVGAGTSANGTGTVTLSRPSITLLADAAYPYQRVVTATDYADVGVPRSFLHDGFDDSSYTASSLDLSGTDKVTVWAGVYKNSDAAAGIALELTSGIASNNGAFTLLGPSSAGGLNFRFSSKGTTSREADATAVAPISLVISGIGDIGGDVCAIRANGVQTAISTGDQGTGNYSNAVLFIARRNNTSNPFNGKIYTIIIRGGVTDAATLALTERYVGSRMGIVL